MNTNTVTPASTLARIEERIAHHATCLSHAAANYGAAPVMNPAARDWTAHHIAYLRSYESFLDFEVREAACHDHWVQIALDVEALAEAEFVEALDLLAELALYDEE